MVSMNWDYALRDLKQQRTRTAFAISGIAISIFLLTVVGMLGDSISYSYVDYASQSAGKIDYEISGGAINMTSVENLVQSNAALNNVLSDYLPRSIAQWSKASDFSVYNPSNGERANRVYQIGVNITLENQAVQGKFLYTNGTAFQGTLGGNECLIEYELASTIGITKAGQSVQFNVTNFADETHNETHTIFNYTVKAIVNFNYKFADSYTNAIIINLSNWTSYWAPSFPGSCEYLDLNLKHPENYYDSRDIPGTIQRLRLLGEGIQNILGFYNTNYGHNTTYNIAMPRVSVLEIASYVNLGMSIILLIVTILGVTISGILINGILTTSIEEKIREFGIFRVLGAHRQLPMKLSVTQALVLSSVGTAIGMLSGYALVRYVLLRAIARLLSFTSGAVVASISTSTIALAIVVGVGVSVIVGIFPALKVGKMNILHAINPYRQETVGTRMVKEGNLNGKFIIIGAVMSAIAAFVLFIVPQILLTLDIGLIVDVIVILLSVFLFGATLVGLGLLPLVQNVIRKIFTSLMHKTKEIVRISMLRYSRRNVTTVVMFSIAFSFITLVSTILGTQSAQSIGQIRNTNGADLVIDSGNVWIKSYTPDSGSLLPEQNMAQELLSYNDIVKTSSMLVTTKELPIVRGISYSLTMSDLVKFKSDSVQGVAIDNNFLDVTYTEYAVFSQGNLQDAFHDVLSGSNNIIISTALSADLQLNLNDQCLLTFQWGNGESNNVQFKIVGVVDNLPGIIGIAKRSSSASGAAIVMNQADFKQYFQLPAGNYYTSRIFVKLASSAQNYDSAISIERSINNMYSESYLFHTYDTYRQGSMMTQIYSTINILFTVILTFTVIISLFGLTSSAYSTILERTREVGIIETLGLKKRSVANMFLIESETIMVSAAINGANIGMIMIFLFYWEIAAFSPFPIMSVFQIPWSTLGLELGIAAIVCAIAMKLLVLRVQRMELIEIFRKTM